MLLIFLFSRYHPSNSAFRVFDIAFVARNQMNVDVKNALPCGFANVYAHIATNVCTLRISRDASCTYQFRHVADNWKQCAKMQPTNLALACAKSPKKSDCVFRLFSFAYLCYFYFVFHRCKKVHNLRYVDTFCRTKVVSFTQTIKCRRWKVYKKSATLVGCTLVLRDKLLFIRFISLPQN